MVQKKCNLCGWEMQDLRGTPQNLMGGPAWVCSNPNCSRNRPRAGSLQIRRDGGFNEYHGHGPLRPDGSGNIDFDDSQGKHSHTVRDKDFNKVWEREEGES